MMFVCMLLEREKVILDSDLFLRDCKCFVYINPSVFPVWKPELTNLNLSFMSLSHLFVLIINCILDVRCIKTYELFSHSVFHVIFSVDVVDEDELLYGESSLPFTSDEEAQEQKNINDRSVTDSTIKTIVFHSFCRRKAQYFFNVRRVYFMSNFKPFLVQKHS